jgi:LSD1 subclass zinc finger protein
MSEAELERSTEGSSRIHCHSCGAELTYKPGTEHLECSYCGAQNEIDQLEMEIEEKHLHDFLHNIDRPVQSVQVILCQACGADNPLDEQKLAENCLFCGSHLMIKNVHELEQYQADALLPFAKNKREVILLWDDWVKNIWWAPNDLKKMGNGTDGIRGVYIPYWTFDANAETHYTGEKGVSRTVKDGDKRKTVTDWYPASGTVWNEFDDVLVLASNSLPQKKAHQLSPWPLNELVVFQDQYLKGFSVETYSESLKDGFENAQMRMKNDIRANVRMDIGGSQQRIHHLDIRWSDERFKLILLPIYISAYQFKGKTYRFLVNGHTGEVQGERPYSFWKIFGAILLALTVILVLYLAFGS